MTGAVVIVPVKSAGRKSRLSGLLGRSDRDQFARALLTDVLDVLGRTGLIRSSVIVSPDGGMLELAARAGARALPEPRDNGVNAAVALGVRSVGRASDVLVIPSDLPLLRPSELRHLLSLRSQGIKVGIAPSLAFDGTNALLFSSGHPVPLSYDDDSFWNHLSGAAREGLSVGVCTEPGLMFDVDSPEEFRALARSKSAGRSARLARRILGWPAS